MKAWTLRRYFSQKLKHIFMFGPPGAGKGTYGDLLIKDTGYVKIAIGDELRGIIKGNAGNKYPESLVQEIKKIVQAGKLISDELALKILEEKLQEGSKSGGVIIDGYPRTQAQLDLYSKKYPTDLVVNICLNLEVLVEKISGRRVCNGCGKNYNVCSIKTNGYDMDPLLPQKEGICDKCQGSLHKRADDNEETVKARLQEYNKNTEPLLKVYEKMNVLFNFEPKRGVKDYPEFYAQLKGKLAKIKQSHQ